jgi:hypothetical protein
MHWRDHHPCALQRGWRHLLRHLLILRVQRHRICQRWKFQSGCRSSHMRRRTGETVLYNKCNLHLEVTSYACSLQVMHRNFPTHEVDFDSSQLSVSVVRSSTLYPDEPPAMHMSRPAWPQWLYLCAVSRSQAAAVASRPSTGFSRIFHDRTDTISIPSVSSNASSAAVRQVVAAIALPRP